MISKLIIVEALKSRQITILANDNPTIKTTGIPKKVHISLRWITFLGVILLIPSCGLRIREIT